MCGLLLRTGRRMAVLVARAQYEAEPGEAREERKKGRKKEAKMG